MIVDASVLLTWFLNEPGAGQAASVFAQQAPIAPAFVLAEAGNGLWSAVRRKRIDANLAHSYLQRTPGLFAELRPTASLFASAYDLAIALDHPIYDCLYLALAYAERRPLLTADQKLQTKVNGTQWRNLVRVLGP